MSRSSSTTHRIASFASRALWAIAFAGAVAIPEPSIAQLVREPAWVTNGRVVSSAYSYANNVIYLGGTFTQVGPAVGSAAALDASTGMAQQPYARVVGTVTTVTPDGNGGWYLGGLFTSVQGQARNNLAQIDASGAVTSWNPGADGQVDAITVSGSTIYVGGLFAHAGGAARNYLAALSASTGAASGWAPSLDGGVRFIGVDGSWVWTGGTFANVGGQSHVGFAAIDVTTGAPNPNTFSSSVQFYGMGIGGGRFFVCSGYNGSYSIAVFNSATAQLLNYGPTVDGSVDAIAVDPGTGTVYIGGSFIYVGGALRKGLAAFDPATNSVLSWLPVASFGVGGPVRALALSPTTVYVGGSFTSPDNYDRNNLFAVDRASGSITGWDPGAGSTVRALATSGSRVYVGGEFGTVNTVRRRNAVAMNATTGTPTDWTPNPNGEVNAILPIGNTVYLGGAFTGVYWLTLTLTPRNRVAAVDNYTGLPLSFDANASSTVLALGYGDNKLYLGGAFGTVGGVSRLGLAAVDPTTGALNAWNPSCNGSVYALRVITSSTILTNPKVIVGGQFTTAGGAARNNIAAIDGVTGLALTWNPNANATVTSLLAFGTIQGGISKVYAGGGFSSIGGQARSCIAALDATGAATAWNPGANNTVYALASLGSNLYVGGAFTAAGGQSRSHVAEIDATTGLATAWDAVSEGGAPPGWVYTIWKANSTVFAGGSFLKMEGGPQQFFAMLGDLNVTAAEAPEVPAAPRAVLASPNPFEGSTTLRFALPRAESAEVAVYDVAGRLVRQIHAGPLRAGEQRMTWNGLDDRSRAVASGIYFLSVRTPTVSLGSKIYRLR